MPPPPTRVESLVDHLFRHEAGKMVAILTRLFGFHNMELAEDILQDTLHQALKDWTLGTIPDNPAGWLMTVAKRKAINAIKREKSHRTFSADFDEMLRSERTAEYTMDQVFLDDEITDSQLRMIFTCCHPALPVEAQLALTLKTLCGFGIPEVAAALLTSESVINKRLYRAKEKLRRVADPFTVPAGRSLQPRLDAVLLVIYLLFNEGYNSSGDNPVIRQDLCLEAMRLAMLLTDRPVTDGYPPLYALLALLCMHSARFEARLDINNSLIVLEEQDRGRWDRGLIDEGLKFLSKSAVGDGLTAYHLEAAIAAEHCTAPDFASTNWTRICEFYSALEKLKPSSVIQLNQAIAIGKKDGPEAAIRRLHQLEQRRSLENYYLLYVSLGEFHQQIGESGKALSYFRRAWELTKSRAIRELLEKKIARI